MGELIPYIKTLRERGISISYRELKSRFIREDPKVCIRRIMDLCEKNNAVFTFCIVGVTAEENPNIIKEIISRGHEIACHGYEHFRFAFSRKIMSFHGNHAFSLNKHDFALIFDGAGTSPFRKDRWGGNLPFS